MATIKQLRTLNKDDYIEADDLYYKVLEVKPNGLELSHPFGKGEKARKKWFYSFSSKLLPYDIPYWNIIRQNSKEAKGIENQTKTNKKELEGVCA